MTLIEHIQQTRPDVLWISGSPGSYTWDTSLPNQSEIEDAISSYDYEAALERDALFYSIAERRAWCESMMERLKALNIENGLNLAQSVWIHSRLRALEITPTTEIATAFPPLEPLVGLTLKIDLMNLVISGDLETAYAVLLCTAPDPMDEPYHCLSQDLIDWILNEIGVYLGWV